MVSAVSIHYQVNKPLNSHAPESGSKKKLGAAQKCHIIIGIQTKKPEHQKSFCAVNLNKSKKKVEISSLEY